MKDFFVIFSLYKLSMKTRAFIFLLLSINLISCKADCDWNANAYRNEECLIIVDELTPDSTTTMSIKGISLVDGKYTVSSENRRWWSTYRDQIERGDTIIKRKGELTFNIHKKDTILSYNWECEGKVYQ